MNEDKSLPGDPDASYYNLRTEWLRFKGHLFDRLTGLPALPAVIEEVRRLVQSRGSAEVIYLDLGRSGRHETKLGWAAYDDTVRSFARALGSLRDAGDLGAQDLICLYTVRSDRFLVFLGGAWDESPNRGPSDSRSRRERLLASLGARIERASEVSFLNRLRLTTGHARILLDPMIRSERAIQQAVADAILMSLAEREGTDALRRGELARMISEDSVRTVFHPIVHLNDGRVIGHEALTRPVGGVSFDSVEELFAFAESTELLLDFERLCRVTAIRAAAAIGPKRGMLFLNTSALAVEDPSWASGEVEGLLASSGLTPGDVVVEITERVAIARREAFQRALRTFKERGYRVAVDDMGAGYASLHALAEIEPDFLKFDVSLVRDIDRSSIKRSLLESLRALADKIHARVIAEGVERDEERRALLALGIELGQGFRFNEAGAG